MMSYVFTEGLASSAVLGRSEPMGVLLLEAGKTKGVVDITPATSFGPSCDAFLLGMVVFFIPVLIDPNFVKSFSDGFCVAVFRTRIVRVVICLDPFRPLGGPVFLPLSWPPSLFVRVGLPFNVVSFKPGISLLSHAMLENRVSVMTLDVAVADKRTTADDPSGKQVQTH